MLKIQRSANEDRLLNNAVIIRADLLQIVTERWRMSGTGARKIPRGQLVCREHFQIVWQLEKAKSAVHAYLATGRQRYRGEAVRWLDRLSAVATTGHKDR